MMRANSLILTGATVGETTMRERLSLFTRMMGFDDDGIVFALVEILNEELDEVRIFVFDCQSVAAPLLDGVSANTILN